MLYQEAIRRGLHVSDKAVAEAGAGARAAIDARQMEFALAYTSRATGRDLDEDTYWSLPQVVDGYRRSLTVGRLVEEISTRAAPDQRESAVMAETERLRAAAAITVSPEFR